jgi:hypothetical protein
MASVVGIDFGNLASKVRFSITCYSIDNLTNGASSFQIGVARQRGIDVIANEVSNRATP